MLLSSWYGPHVLVCMPDNVSAPNETTDGVLGEHLPDVDRGVAELLDSLRCNLVVSDVAKHNVPEMFCWI